MDDAIPPAPRPTINPLEDRASRPTFLFPNRLRPSAGGIVRCLKCGKNWKSPDRKSRRICGDCTSGQERTGIAGEIASGVDRDVVGYTGGDGVQDGFEPDDFTHLDEDD